MHEMVTYMYSISYRYYRRINSTFWSLDTCPFKSVQKMLIYVANINFFLLNVYDITILSRARYSKKWALTDKPTLVIYFVIFLSL